MELGGGVSQGELLGRVAMDRGFPKLSASLVHLTPARDSEDRGF